MQPKEEKNWAVPFSRPFTSPDRREELVALERVLKSGQWTQGPEVEAFEREAAEYLGCPEGHECVAVSSCTAGLYLLLKALWSPGMDRQRVNIPDLTFAATANAVLAAGLVPVVHDVDQRGVLDSESWWHGWTICVSYAGLLDPPKIGGECESLMIHDQAHSFQPGAYRPYSAWSFYPTKNITGGEGGLVGAPSRVAAVVRELRNHGRSAPYQADHAGALNFRMTDFQAALLRVQLQHLPEAFSRKREIEAFYRNELGGWVKLPPKGVTHLFWIRHPRREELKAALEAAGIQASIHYRTLTDLWPRIEGRFGIEVYSPYKEAVLPITPVAHRIAAETLSLPWFPGMTEGQVEAVVKSVVDACKKCGAFGAEAAA